MKITSIQWNIGGGYRRDEDADSAEAKSYNIPDLDYIIQTLKKYNPDLITLQETHSNDSLNQVEKIAQALGYKYYFNDIYDQSHVEKGQGLGQGVISRFPIENHNFQFFVNPKLEIVRPNGEKWITHDKGISKCEISLENYKKILIKTLHMVPFRKFGVDPKSEEMSYLIKDIENKVFGSESNVLLQGDFNLDTELLKEIFDHNYSEIKQSTITTPSGKKYDHILYLGMVLKNSDVVKALTDHFPIYSEFEI